MKKLNIIQLSIFTCLILTSNVNAALIEMFSGSIYDNDESVLNENLGISDWLIEDFEDLELVDGLGISFTSVDTGVFTSIENEINTYPTLAWDGTGLLTNSASLSGAENVWAGSLTQGITFHFEGGTKGFGIGLANFSTRFSPTHALKINGEFVNNLEDFVNYNPDSIYRNGYLKIVSDDNELIHSISFENESIKDGLAFDHLAFVNGAVNVNEPRSVILFLLAACLLFVRKYKLLK